MKEYVKKIKSIGDPTRIRIMKILIESRYDLCVCEIVDSLKTPFYTISKHMKELRNAGLIDETRDGKFIIYSVTKSSSLFASSLLSLLKNIPDKYFKNDIELLKKRLSLRKKGKCIVGMSECRKKNVK
jgi:ArsR family transcriptional regulator, arsenate/arsenite/antimonite-responsive transcriptional repressor